MGTDEHDPPVAILPGHQLCPGQQGAIRNSAQNLCDRCGAAEKKPLSLPQCPQEADRENLHIRIVRAVHDHLPKAADLQKLTGDLL